MGARPPDARRASRGHLLIIGVLSFPTVVTSGVALLVGWLTGLSAFEELALWLVYWGSLLGFVGVGFAGVLARRVACTVGIQTWVARSAVLMVVLRLAVQCGLAYLIMAPGLVELP